MRDYLTVTDLIVLHDDQVARYGGTPGVRDRGLLEAALYRPQTGAYPDLIAEAAALWESLATSRPFHSGNQRTAFAALHVFLRINGLDIGAAPDIALSDLNALIAAGPAMANMEHWLR